MHDYTIMFIIMIISGFLSNMNVYANNIDDIRFSINDLYMSLLMTGWMFLFMGLYYKQNNIIIYGLLLVVFSIFAIRNQFLVNQKQYILGMIPHHSMAVHMSKKLLDKKNNLKTFLKNIIINQSIELNYMKKILNN